MKTWLITGCSSGIGKGIAKAVLESGDQAIVLKTSFHTNYFAWKIGLNSNYDYEDYQWIFVRNKNEKWKHVDGGYG